MARTVPQLVALGVTMAVRDKRRQRPIPFKGAWPGRAWHGAQWQEALREGDVRRQWAYVPHLPQQGTGTLTLADVQRIIEKADPDDTFLIHDALDDDGVGTTRVQAHATIRYTIPLPPWISMADDPGATHVTVFRGIPSTRNTPALDPVLLHDGRAPTLQEQALGRHPRPLPEHRRTDDRRSSMPLRNSSEPTRTSSPRMSSGSSPPVDRRPSCPLESRRPSSEDARSLSTRPSPLLPRTASAPSVMAVRC